MPITDDDRAKLKERREEARKLRPTWKLSAAQKEELVEGYIAGETVKELAGRFGVRRQTVFYHLDRAAGDR